LYLPGVRASDGFEVVVRVIHSADRFEPTIPPVDTPLTWTAGPLDLWSGTLAVVNVGGTHFGSEGTYLYVVRVFRTDGVRE
jgi:hypothetical protein